MSIYPIDPYLDAIADALNNSAFTLLKAEPGAGKSTRVPLALLTRFNKILVVQPRRLAARLAAGWVAEQSGQALGSLVGYQIRLDNKSTPATRLLFVTEGVFTRKLLQDRQLREFDLVILDEFHERHLHTDLALALLKSLVERRSDLRVLVMSATLELLPLQAYLGEVPSFEVPGRTFPITMVYRPPGSQQSLEDQVQGAVLEMLEDPRCGGNILVFLSGLSEIQSCSERLLQHRDQFNFDIVPLTAELAVHYDALFKNSGRRKLVLSTNVAETSVTLPDIRGVIDSGWAKISGYASWSGLPTLERQRISQASAVQRAGRAGRVAPGVCYRLYSASDFQARPAVTRAEIDRVDLCQMLLEVQAILPDQPYAWNELLWFERPLETHLSQSQALLLSLGALSESGHLTHEGRKMAELPLHPRLARLVFAGTSSGVGPFSLLAALVINEGGLLSRSQPQREQGSCDVCYQLNLLLQPSSQSQFLDRGRVQGIRQLYESLRQPLGFPPLKNLNPEFEEEKVRHAIFHAFADRVAKFRPMAQGGARGIRHYNFCMGRGGILGERSIVREAEWIVAVSARETLGEDPSQRCRIETASAIEAAWLEEDPFLLRQQGFELDLDEKSGRVRKLKQELYGKLIVKECVEQAAIRELSELLSRAVRERWSDSFMDLVDLRSYHGKLRVLDRHKIEHRLPEFTGDFLDLLIAHLCEGSHSLSEVRSKNLRQAIEEQLNYEDIMRLNELCPDYVVLKNGRKMKVHYEDEGDPWIEARIQEFFGQRETPLICRERQALLCKLLAPSRRPAQITQDLRGFWLGSYQEVKKELKRRYPKHAWPDDPLTHEAPTPPTTPVASRRSH